MAKSITRHLNDINISSRLAKEARQDGEYVQAAKHLEAIIASANEALAVCREKMPAVPFSIRAPRETTPILGRDGQLHAVAAGYDGEGEGPRGGVYGWFCHDCSAAGTDYGSEDDAALGASGHLAEVEPYAEVVSA